ncbi:MAG TPA: ankyrin repeat domain-containing protein [Sphingomicrobium sp.]|nr:ankyrin repeat domain-containing protein [Sphingomicrobium sp.]
MKRAINRAAKLALAAGLAAILAAGAAAQFAGSDAEAFLNAIRDQNGSKATAIEAKQGGGVVNYRGYSGDTPLTVAMAKRSRTYVGFLLSKGATPDLADKRGDTPLIIAARNGFNEGVDLMISSRATIDLANKQGETPLIVAVQGRHPTIVRRLLEAGANPDKTDFAAGYSARDYARRDNRNRDLLKMIETIKRKKPAMGPTRS